MFTGIITHLGQVLNQTKTKLIISTDKDFLARLEPGASVAVDGICLTVIAHNPNSFTVNLMPETVNRTNLRDLQSGSLVNLELPATPNSLLSGHIVNGHIDGIGKLQSLTKKGNSRILTFAIPNSNSKYLVEKGSIAVNGISLTVIKAAKNHFTTGIIPHTWKNTMLHRIKIGDLVNVEVDILAKYAEKFLMKGKK